MAKAKDTSSAQNSSTASFHLFTDLHEDLKLAILSFVADAPFESMPENYPKSSLTHTLPLVSKQFRVFCEEQSYWKAAIERQFQKEPFLWKRALHKICDIAPASKEAGTATAPDLVEQAAQALQKPSFKALYKKIVTDHIRFKGPVFFMGGQVQLGEPYALHFFEPRYRLLITEVMRGQPESAKNGGRIPHPALFVHANRAPLAPTTPATIVEIVQCQVYPDGRADVLLLPTAYVWIEKVWVRPNSGHLYYAQCLRMGQSVTHSMNQLSRQETLTNVMDMLAGRLDNTDEEDDTEHARQDDDTSSDEDSG